MNWKRLLLGGLVGFLLMILLGGGFVYWRVSQITNFAAARGDGAVADIVLPEGFTANLFAEGLNGPRFLATGPDGVLYAADRRNGRIVRLPDADGNGEADSIDVFANELTNPHSLVYYEGAWYVGVPSGVVKLVDGDGDGVAETRETIIDDYPTSGSHTTRTVDFLPDGRMVVSIGSSCNVCEEEDERRATIVVYDGAAGTGERIFARGLRNAVGLAVQPQTGALWATNNGRDLMGDDEPPETIYRVEEGANYGWPLCHNGYIIDPGMGEAGDCDGVARPIVEMQAHSAPLGLTFYTGTTFPNTYHDDLFIAFHGSWNRSVPTGYKVVRLPFAEGVPAQSVEDFATGWLDEQTAESYGRPVGIVVGGDGALYVSDDKGGYIYRIQYVGD